jgi:hypothetical protein
MKPSIILIETSGIGRFNGGGVQLTQSLRPSHSRGEGEFFSNPPLTSTLAGGIAEIASPRPPTYMKTPLPQESPRK